MLEAAAAPRHLNTSLRTKMPMPMSKSSTRMRRMISIMTRTKKPPVMPGAKFTRRRRGEKPEINPRRAVILSTSMAWPRR
jgi:hypothetical protein